MMLETILWVLCPFVAGFVIMLLPRLDRLLAVVAGLVSVGFGAQALGMRSPLIFQLLDSAGVTLQIDTLGGYFILTNAVVTLAVLFYCWQSDRTSFFYAQLLMLHGSLNAAFICADFMSLYVALEVTGIAAFLLIAYPRSDRTLWVGLRYLFISNVAMLFYLVGAVLVYQTHQSFQFAGLVDSPPEALALIFLGLLAKGGIFVSGLWLPLTHSESDTPVSAMLSGVVVKASLLPLLRCSLIQAEIGAIVATLGIGTALLGVGFAMFERDAKRMLALSTLSQVGFILVAPEMGGFYALSHGMAKSSLFLSSGSLPSRDFKVLQQTPLALSLWLPLAIAGLSISGFPGVIGFGAKVWTTKQLLPWQGLLMTIAATGTAVVFAKFLFLPRGPWQPPKPNYLAAQLLLLGGLVAGNGFYLKAYTLANLGKALITIAIGWLLYFTIAQRLTFKLPNVAEQFEHLIGVMSLMLVLLFWMALA
ncbi:cation:proton antiporter [Spirulina major]|uniref:cation:proton antiporter n=1 Tax=Spirulina major TaxID=270636 RepID=UPI0009324985|nr:cation:proton antiporter [Spirulina major]